MAGIQFGDVRRIKIESNDLKMFRAARRRDAAEMPEAKNGDIHGALFVGACVVNPPVLLQPLKRASNALFNRERRFPAGGADFLGVEKDERVVADPSTIATGIFEFWIQAERAADDADGVVDLNVFIRAEIVDLHAVFGALRGAEIDDMEHGAHAIADVKITFSLRAIAEDFQRFRGDREAVCKNRKRGRACSVRQGSRRNEKM